MHVLIFGPRFLCQEASNRLAAAGFECTIDLEEAQHLAPPAVVVSILDLATASESDGEREPSAVRVVPIGSRSPELQSATARVRELLRERCGPESSSAPCTGSSEEARAVNSSLRQLAGRPRAPTLMAGEVGVGRRFFAEQLHRMTFGEGEFVSLLHSQADVQLMAILAERRARADVLNGSGVTIFVPDVASLPRPAQMTLSSVVRNNTSRALRTVFSVGPGAFPFAGPGVLPELKNQFYSEVAIPALRQRTADIPALSEVFAAQASRRLGIPPATFAPSAMAALTEHSWPGNVRELRSVIERAVALATGSVVQRSDLPAFGAERSEFQFVLPPDGISFERLERDAIVQAMRQANNNQTTAAKLLGLTRDRLRYRLLKFGIPFLPVKAQRGAMTRGAAVRTVAKSLGDVEGPDKSV